MSSTALVVFTLAEQEYAVRLSCVTRIVPAVHVLMLPKAPEIVLGVINVQGTIVAVVDARKRFGLPDREIGLSDHFLIARALNRMVALVVDKVNGVVECPEGDLVKAETILPNLEHVAGILKLPSGVIFVHDLDRFLSLDENQTLEKALQQETT